MNMIGRLKTLFSVFFGALAATFGVLATKLDKEGKSRFAAQAQLMELNKNYIDLIGIVFIQFH